MIKVTQEQQRLLDFIRQHIHDQGFAPSVREIATAFGGRSTNAINGRLAVLERKGYIARVDHKARSIRLLNPDAQQSHCPSCTCFPSRGGAT